MVSSYRMPAPKTPGAESAEFSLEVLNLLPCGCVVAIQRMPLSGMRMVSLEAKGPHCLYPEHRVNKVIRLGEEPDADDFDDYDTEDVRVA